MKTSSSLKFLRNLLTSRATRHTIRRSPGLRVELLEDRTAPAHLMVLDGGGTAIGAITGDVEAYGSFSISPGEGAGGQLAVNGYPHYGGPLVSISMHEAFDYSVGRVYYLLNAEADAISVQPIFGFWPHGFNTTTTGSGTVQGTFQIAPDGNEQVGDQVLLHITAYAIPFSHSLSSSAILGFNGAEIGPGEFQILHRIGDTVTASVQASIRNSDNNSSGGFAVTQLARMELSLSPAPLLVDAIINVNPYSGQYDANAHGISGTATGTHGEDLSSLLTFGATYIDAGHYTANWTFAGNDTYRPANGTSTIDISQATPTVVVNPAAVVYDGNPHGTTGEAYGVNGVDLGPVVITYNTTGGGAPVDAGNYIATGTFAGNQDYFSASGTSTVDISRATAFINIDSYSGPYDGNPHGISGTARGALHEDLTNLLTFGETYVDGGHYVANWIFAGNNNYQPANGTSTIDISRVNPIANVSPVAATTYDGLSHGTTGQVVGINGIVLSNSMVYIDGQGNVLNGAPVHAGTYTATVSFPGNSNYTPAYASTSIVIYKADALIDVPSIFLQYDGNIHVLSGTATGVQGEDLSALLNIFNLPAVDAGLYVIDWRFDGNIDYNSAIGISFIEIDKAPPTASINPVAATTYDSHSHGTTGQVVGVNGVVLPSTITYRDDHDNVLSDAPVNAGVYTATISFPGNDNYLPSSASTTILIGKATPTASIDPVTANYDGNGHSAVGQVLGVNGIVLTSTIIYRDSQNHVLNGAPVNAGVYTATISFSGSNNYTPASAFTTIVILSAEDQLTVLIGDVADLGLNTGNANALTTKLNNAFTKLSQGNITAGVNLMRAFINQVNAFAYSGQLSQAQADELTAAANAVIYSVTH